MTVPNEHLNPTEPSSHTEKEAIAAAAHPILSSLDQVAEALVFAADEPVTATRIAEVYAEVTGLPSPSRVEIEEAIARLNEIYSSTGRALRINAWSGGFRMATVPAMAAFVKALFHQVQQRRLSRSLLETLAILAYRQPTTKPEIDYVRGVDSDYALRRLLEMGFINVLGRSDAIGRPLLYGTTPRFLEQFGINTLEDLPNLREIEALLNDPAFNRERARLLMQKGLVEHTDQTQS